MDSHCKALAHCDMVNNAVVSPENCYSRKNIYVGDFTFYGAEIIPFCFSAFSKDCFVFPLPRRARKQAIHFSVLIKLSFFVIGVQISNDLFQLSFYTFYTSNFGTWNIRKKQMIDNQNEEFFIYRKYFTDNEGFQGLHYIFGMIYDKCLLQEIYFIVWRQ